jgi:hypothetical protein
MTPATLEAAARLTRKGSQVCAHAFCCFGKNLMPQDLYTLASAKKFREIPPVALHILEAIRLSGLWCSCALEFASIFAVNDPL